MGVQENPESDDEVDTFIEAIVPSEDDQKVPVLTFRVLLLSIIWSIFLSFLKTLF